MISANIFPRSLFVSIRREKPHVEASKRLVESASLDVEGVYRLLNTAAAGLTNDEAQRRLKQYGANVLATDSQNGFGKIFLHAVLNPLVLLLKRRWI